MANVTFSSPRMARDVTVYAVAGDRGTLLALAKSHKVPIPFDCQDGECGSCLVEVTHLDPGARAGMALTEKEKEMLRQLGKLTAQELADAEVNDMPPRCRLACQTFVRHEDIMVSFAGDESLPEQRPALSTAAAVYRGGVEVHTLDEFLSYAVKVEEDAALHFEHLAEAMEACGNAGVAALFRQLGGYSRLHLQDARTRCQHYDASLKLPANTAWPDNLSPERTNLWAGDPELTPLGALKAALLGERRGYEFYYAVSETARNPDVRAAAREFAREEHEHVEKLKEWIAKASGSGRDQA